MNISKKLSPKQLEDLIKVLNSGTQEHEEHPMPQIVMTEDKVLDRRGILFLDKDITKESVSVIIEKLLSLEFDENFTDSVQLIINSPGGYLDAMWALVDTMDSVRYPIRTVAMGQICSAATMIFIAGDERIMSPNSVAMVHHFSGGNYGGYPELIASRKNEDMQFHKIVNHFIRNGKYTTAKEVTDHILLDQDNWLSPQEMKKHGLCDTVMVAPDRKKKKKTKK